MLISRRQTLLSGAALPLAAAAPSLVQAQATTTATLPTHRDFTWGDFRVTTLLSGSRRVENLQGIFGMNVDAETFAAVSAENFIPTDAAQSFSRHRAGHRIRGHPVRHRQRRRRDHRRTGRRGLHP